MNIKFNKYIFLLCIKFFGIVNFPLKAGTIDTYDLVKTISNRYHLSERIDSFEALLDELDYLRHHTERDKRTALDIYNAIGANHSYLQSLSIPHQNRFYRGFSKTNKRLGDDAIALNILADFVRRGNADLTTQSCYYDTLYYNASRQEEAITGWQDICDNEDATDSLKAGAHLKLADHFKSEKEKSISHFNKALLLSRSDQSVLDLNYKAKALVGLAQLEDRDDERRGLFLDALRTLKSIKHPKSFHNELLIHTYLGLAQNPTAHLGDRQSNFEQALEIAYRIDDYYSKAQAHIGLGNMVDSDDQGREHYRNAIHCIGSHRNEADIYLLTEAHIGLGNKGNKQNFEEALSLLRPLGEDTYPHLWAQAYIGLGQDTKATDHDRKLDFEDAIKIAKKHHKYDLVAKAYIGMGNARFGSKYFKKALHYLEKVVKHKHPRLWAQAYLGLANSTDREENEDQLYYYEKARDIACANNFTSILEKAYLGLGHFHLSKRKIIESTDYFNKAYRMSGDDQIIKKFSNKFYIILKELLKIGFEYHIEQRTYPTLNLEKSSREFLTKNFSRISPSEKEFTDHFALEGFKTLRMCEQEAIRAFFPGLKELTDSYFYTGSRGIYDSRYSPHPTSSDHTSSYSGFSPFSVVPSRKAPEVLETPDSSDESLPKITSKNNSETGLPDSVGIIESLSASSPSSTGDMKKRYFNYDSDSSGSVKQSAKRHKSS